MRRCACAAWAVRVDGAQSGKQGKVGHRSRRRPGMPRSRARVAGRAGQVRQRIAPGVHAARQARTEDNELAKHLWGVKGVLSAKLECGTCGFSVPTDPDTGMVGESWSSCIDTRAPQNDRRLGRACDRRRGGRVCAAASRPPAPAPCWRQRSCARRAALASRGAHRRPQGAIDRAYAITGSGARRGRGQRGGGRAGSGARERGC